jgi:hypothetical protein
VRQGSLEGQRFMEFWLCTTFKCRHEYTGINVRTFSNSMEAITGVDLGVSMVAAAINALLQVASSALELQHKRTDVCIQPCMQPFRSSLTSVYYANLAIIIVDNQYHRASDLLTGFTPSSSFLVVEHDCAESLVYAGWLLARYCTASTRQ